MTRADRAGLGVALGAHVLLFGILSLGFIAAPQPLVIPPPSIDVSLVDEIGPVSAQPVPAVEPPAPSVAPDTGVPEEAAAPTPEVVEPEPALAPPAPAPKPTPAPKAVAPTPPAPAARPAARPATKAATGTAPAANSQRPRGSRLGRDFLKGIASSESTSTSATPRAAVTGQAMAGLADAIRRQVQPCADRITNPGPGANAIATKLNLKLARDGTFSVRPSVVSQTGVDGGNARYAKRVGELATAAFIQCSPFKLPPELYEGWKNVNLNYRLPA